MKKQSLSKTKQKALPKATEHQIQNACIGLLRYHRFYVQRLNAGKYSMGDGRSRRFVQGVAAGTPDIFAFKEIYPEGTK